VRRAGGVRGERRSKATGASAAGPPRQALPEHHNPSTKLAPVSEETERIDKLSERLASAKEYL
jgi:hypothetical protein